MIRAILIQLGFSLVIFVLINSINKYFYILQIDIYLVK